MSKRLTNNKMLGFTLIELLAVIVILAIIATIATPIVLSIIEDTKESARLRSAEYYLDAVETTIATAILKNTNINAGRYKIKDGDICLDSSCIQNLKVEIKGETPASGTINIDEGQISDVTLFLDNKVITNSQSNKLVYTELEYTIGDKVTFNPGDKNRTWNVIDEDATTVTLLLSENLGGPTAWDSSDSNFGPKDALNHLNSLTTEWDNVAPIENYSYINNLNGTKPYGYQKLEIKNGVAKLIHKDAKQIIEVTEISKSRILTLEEVLEIGAKTNINLTEENLRLFIEENLSTINQGFGVNLTTVDEVLEFITQMDSPGEMQYMSKYMQTYWAVLGIIEGYGIGTKNEILLPDYLYDSLYLDQSPYAYLTLSSELGQSSGAWNVDGHGYLSTGHVTNDSDIGVRPVITVSKSNVSKFENK